jgi:hypothetical protein
MTLDRMMNDQDRFEYEVSREEYGQWLDKQDPWWVDYDRNLETQNCEKEKDMKAPKSDIVEFEKHPAKTVAVVCTKVLDLGTHYNEKKMKDERKFRIDFESTELMQDGEYAGKPFLLIANFNFSMYQNSRLCQFVEAWMGRKFPSQDEADNFDLDTLLGKTALVNVIHSDDGKWVNIGSIMPLPEGMPAPTPVGGLITFDCDNPNQAMLEKLSEKTQQKIKASNEMLGLPDNPPTLNQEGQPELNDDIPF